MAEELNDVVKLLQEQNSIIKTSIEGTATQQAKDAEARQERKTYDNEVLGTLKSIQNIMGQNFKGLNQGDKKGGGLIAGLLGGIGSAVGAVFKAVAKISLGFVKGMAALGGGIAAFMLALGGASMILGLMGSDGSELKAVIENFFGAFSPETTIMMGGIILLATYMTKAKLSSFGFAKAMTALGAGIGAFFIAIGAASWLVGAAGLSGTALAEGLENFFGAFSLETVGLMTGVVLLAATLTELKVNEGHFVMAMGAIGAGIGAFFIAIGAASWLTQAAGLSGTSLATGIESFFSAFSKETVAIMTGVVALATTMATFPSKPGKKEFIASMGTLGAGIGAFFIGIGAADWIVKAAGVSGTHLKTLMKNFFGAFTPEAVALMTGMAVLATTAATIPGSDPVKMAASMTALGAGFAGFFIGILAAAGFAKMGEAVGVTGVHLKTLMKNFVDAFTDAGATGVAVLVAILSVGTLASIGKADPATIFASMSAMGAGLAGFFGGILLADWITKKAASGAGVDGTHLKTLMKNFLGAFTEVGETGVAVLAAILGVGAITGIVSAATGGTGAATMAAGIFAGMFAMGAGLVGFFGGIILADKLTQMAEADGSSIAKLITNFLGAFKSKKDIATLAVLLAAAGAASFNPVGVAAGMTAIGAGLVGFFTAFVGGDFLAQLAGVDTKKVGEFMGDVGEGIGRFIGGLGSGIIKQMNEIDGKKLAEVGKGIADLGIGLLAFSAGGLLGVLDSIISGLASFFGAKSPIDKIAEISQRKDIDADRIKEIGESIGPLAQNMKGFSGVNLSNLDNFDDFINGIMVAGSKDIDAVQVGTLAKAIGPMGEAMSSWKGVNLEGVVGTGGTVKKNAKGFSVSTGGTGNMLATFFATLSSENLNQVAPLTKITEVTSGLKLFGEALQTFKGLDASNMNYEDFFKSLSNVGAKGGFWEGDKTQPDKIIKIASSIEILGNAMNVFASIDSEKIEKNIKLLSGFKTGKAEAKSFLAFPVTPYQEGGFVPQTMPALVHKGEFILDKQAADIFLGAAQMLAGSRSMERSNGGSPVIVNNNNIDASQTNSSSQATTLRIPESVRSGEPTMATAIAAYAS